MFELNSLPQRIIGYKVLAMTSFEVLCDVR